MHALLQSACRGLVDGFGWRGAACTNPHESAVFMANTVFRSLLPWRDYDRRVQTPLSKREASLKSIVFAPRKTVTIKEEPREEVTNKRKREDEKGTNIIALDEMPDVQVKSEEKQNLGDHTTATTISDANTAEKRAVMQKGVIEATAALRVRIGAVFVRDANTGRSEVAKLARTIVILLLEPFSLRIVSVIQRPDDELVQRESARLITNTPLTVEDQRAMNRHVLSLSINLFAGLPELAVDMIKLESSAVLKAAYFFVVFSELLFATCTKSSTQHVMDDFRHNSELEHIVDRGELIGATLCALLRGVETHYRLTLRRRLMMAVDTAISEVSSMRQPYNNSPANIARLNTAKEIVNKFEII
jgi:hypothetical protein